MAVLPTNLGIKFPKKTLRKFYQRAVTPMVTNSNYEGEIKGGGADRLRILSFLNDVALSDYVSGTAMTPEKWMGDVVDDLLVNQKKYFDFEIDELNAFEAAVDDIDSNLIDNAAKRLERTIDTYVLARYTDVKVGHRRGSDYKNNDFYKMTDANSAHGVATAAATGAVTFADPGIGMRPLLANGAANNDITTLVGHGISFDNGVTWYRISVYTSSVSVTVTDWNGSTYTGGVQTGVNYIIEALYPKHVSKTTIFADISAMATYLDNDEIPQDERWFVGVPDVVNLLKMSTEMTPAVPVAYEKVVLNGLIGKCAGFDVYSNVCITGSGAYGWHCLAGHKSFITFAHAFTQSRVVESENNFAKQYQGLNEYGAKVARIRRKCGAELYCIIDTTKIGKIWADNT